MFATIKKHAKAIKTTGIALTACLALMIPALYLHSTAVPPPAVPAEDNGNGIGMPDIEKMESADKESTISFAETQPLRYSYYKLVKGDMIGDIANRFGLTQDTILSVNGIKNSRLLQVGQTLKIPNQDGLRYIIKSGDSISGIAQKYEIEPVSIKTANTIDSGDLRKGDSIFLPAARLSSADLQEINGDLFGWPVHGTISSYYGYRSSPFTGSRQFHNGLDIACAYGTPIKAGMAGMVRSTGYDPVSGNYVILSHHSGYRTLYCHMSVIRVKPGEYVQTGQRIGDVGSTGLSTGAHCHFTVLKNGRTVNPLGLVN